jgi:universal stress protein A
MKPIKTILHPTDFSEHSQLALELAAAIARDQDASLVILHVVPLPAPFTGAGKVAEMEQAERRQRDLLTYHEEMRSRLRRLVALAGDARVEYVFKEGEVARVILRVAEERPCGLIVLGTHGKSGYHRAMLGSVAAEVSHKALCPVLTVKLPVPKERAVAGAVPEEASLAR